MLTLEVKGRRLWDERNQEFLYTNDHTLVMEHSLVSISKWESIWCKPFLGKDPMTSEQTISYIKCMTITKNVDPNIYFCLTNSDIEKVRKYIEAPMTATTVYDDSDGKGSKETITSELIYYWMLSLNIPVEFQKWHLNRLLTLIKVCNVKNKPPKKMSKSEIYARNARLNAERKRRLGTKG
jgi:hypothetical protein